jgi:hypothetical protein
MNLVNYLIITLVNWSIIFNHLIDIFAVEIFLLLRYSTNENCIFFNEIQTGI